MRSFHSDSEYFEFLDGLNGALTSDIMLAAGRLAMEFPWLRPEEAKAICTDWRARKHR
ncbi:MAG: hypothetical protein IJ087_18210 [Eggerthellaceae bacterium]|nr:hypothetical protein [Eggerthellaceae bacterium]